MLRTAFIASAVVACAQPALAQTILYEIPATQPDEGLGTLALGGDFDGDGVADLALGSPRFDVPAAADAGRIRLISSATGAILRTIEGHAVSGYVGTSIAIVGDVNGDATPDVLGGEFGSAGAHAVVWSGATGAVLRTYFGNSPSEFFGAAVLGVGDVDGDGVEDHLISESLYSSGGPSGFDRGAVHLYSGSTGTLLRTHLGATAFGLLGQALAYVGDFDLDGRRDYALGAPGSTNTTVPTRVEVHSAATGALLREFVDTAGSGFGGAIVPAGDVDLDGVPDLTITRSYWNASGSGLVSTISGASGATLRSWPADCINGAFGMRLAGGSDVTGDGVPDVAISTVWGARVGDGASGGTATDLVLATSPAGFKNVLFLPDVTGDGRAELAVAGQSPHSLRVYSDPFATPQTAVSCFGDGSSSACPCGNTGQSGAGCANSTGLGAVLEAAGDASVSQDTLWLRLTAGPNGTRTGLFSSTALTSATPFFDGLNCLAAPHLVQRRSTCQGNGSALFGLGLVVAQGWTPGQTRHLQAVYRNSVGPCGAGANTSNVLSVVVVP